MFNVVDMHCHIVPGIDDGPSTLEESMAMVQIAYEEGIRRIVVTPHNKPGKFPNTYDTIKEKTKVLYRAIKEAGIDMKLYLGCEHFFEYDFPDKLLEGNLMTMGGRGHYVLVEFMPSDDWDRIRDAVQRIRMSGYKPLIAHVERYMEVVKNIDRVKELIDMGAYIQMNANTIASPADHAQKKFVKQMLKHKYLHFVGTDAHSSSHRAPRMQKCLSVLIKAYGEGGARRILHHHPYQMMKDEELDPW